MLKKINIVSTNLDTLVKEIKPDVFRLILLFTVYLLVLLLATQQFCKRVFDKVDDVFFVKAWDNVFVDAKLLQTMQLEEVCQPQHVLHKIDIRALLVLVAARPKHFSGVDKVKDNPKCLRSGP